jgi:hypothetical protein
MSRQLLNYHDFKNDKLPFLMANREETQEFSQNRSNLIFHDSKFPRNIQLVLNNALKLDVLTLAYNLSTLEAEV